MADRSMPSATAGQAPSPPSPLDPFLFGFLREVDALAGGYSPVAQTRAVAAGLDLEIAFVETLFISARARGLVAISFERGSRNRWRVSARGRRWLDAGVGGDTSIVAEALAPVDIGLGAADEGESGLGER